MRVASPVSRAAVAAVAQMTGAHDDAVTDIVERARAFARSRGLSWLALFVTANGIEGLHGSGSAAAVVELELFDVPVARYPGGLGLALRLAGVAPVTQPRLSGNRAQLP